jgi:type IV pilus assembly protein PilQ
MRRTASLAALLWFAGSVWAPAASQGPPPLGDPVTLDVKDADLRELLLSAFAPRTRLNLVVDPEVKGSVTVRLDHVPFDQALDAVVTPNGWGWTVEGRILRIGHPEKLNEGSRSNHGGFQ